MAEHEIVWFGKKAGHENRPESLLHPFLGLPLYEKIVFTVKGRLKIEAVRRIAQTLNVK